MKATLTLFATLVVTLVCIPVMPQVGSRARPEPPPTNTNSAPRRTTPTRRTPPARTGRSTATRPNSNTASSGEEPAAATERTFWESIRDSSDPEDFREYLRQYPNGQFAGLARNRIRQLETAARPANTGAPSVRPNTAPATRPATFTNAVGVEFVLVPAGSFMMGTNNGDADERPAHQVAIGNSFYMGKYEVTQGQWQRVMGTTVRQQRDRANPALPILGEGDNYPMHYVSWEEAQAFVNALNGRTDGYQYRLPTEAEWEYACRAGTTEDYAGVLDALAWYGNNSGRQYIDAAEIWRTDQSNYGSRILANGNQTQPVGTKQPNAWGLYDMHGNVWEWVLDYYHENYNGAPSDGSAWLSDGDSRYRVQRGGSWVNDADILRSANRSRHSPDYRSYAFGFRLVAVARQ